jgi:solute carrier family 35 protein F1/2
MICCLGVGINLLSDYEKSEVDPSTLTNANDQMEEQEYPNRLLGDFFAVLGGLLVGMSDVVIELLVKDFSGNGGTDEYLACVGIFGAIISFTQAAILERSAISKFFAPGLSNVNLADEYQQYDDPYDAPRTCSQSKGLLLLIAYVTTSYLFNVGTSRFLAVSESALLTLSILTCDLWAVMFTVFAEHIAPTHLFYIAFVLIVIGVFVYETAPSPLEAEEYEASNQLKLQKSTNYHHNHHQTHHPNSGSIVAVAVDRSDHKQDERDII